MVQSPASWLHGRLLKLKRLRVNYDEDACMASLARVSAFFHLPSLLIFEAERVVGWTCPMGSSSITTIKLLDCAFSLPGLWNFIRSCKRLTSFTSAFTEYFEVPTCSPGGLFEHLAVVSVICFWHFSRLRSAKITESGRILFDWQWPSRRLKTITIKIHKLLDLQGFDHLQPIFARIASTLDDIPQCEDPAQYSACHEQSNWIDERRRLRYASQ
ncbi:hypothetical protein V2W45_1464969 [Cenococcum geophilum]